MSTMVNSTGIEIAGGAAVFVLVFTFSLAALTTGSPFHRPSCYAISLALALLSAIGLFKIFESGNAWIILFLLVALAVALLVLLCFFAVRRVRRLWRCREGQANEDDQPGVRTRETDPSARARCRVGGADGRSAG